MMKETKLTQAALKALLSYDPETGIFTRIKSVGGKNRAGQPAGTITKLGYVQIYVCGAHHTAHRLAWLYMTGEVPASGIDHKDENKQNNRFDNLRLATNAQNFQNISAARSDSGTGLRGVSKNRRGKPFRARIKVNGKETTIGSFCTVEEAHAAYLDVKKELHPFSDNVRIRAKGVK
jgi:hypothetical protein